MKPKPGLQENGCTWVIETPRHLYTFHNPYIQAILNAGWTRSWPAVAWEGTLTDHLKRFPPDFLLFPDNDHPNDFTHVVPTHEAAYLWMVLKFTHL